MAPEVKLHQQRVANIAIGASTLRNQGAPKVIAHAREYLGKMNLERLTEKPEAFPEKLNYYTVQLQNRLPEGAQNWGTSRKAINVFLEECYLNRHVYEEYRFSKVGHLLEVPLDQQVVTWLKRYAYENGHDDLPTWNGIIRLDPEASATFQNYALLVSPSLGEGWKRIDIDLVAWGAKKTNG